MDLETEITDLSLVNLLDKATVNQQDLRYGFQIGNLNLIYDIHLSCELLKNIPVYSIPNTPKWMLGLINLRGNLIPVFDLEDYFGFEGLDNQYQLWLVLGKGSKAVAFRVKDYPELLSDLTKETIIPKLIPKIENHIIAVYKGEKLWLELDKESFFLTLGKMVCI